MAVLLEQDNHEFIGGHTFHNFSNVNDALLTHVVKKLMQCFNMLKN